MLTENSEYYYYDGHKTLMAKCPNGYNYQGERYRGDVLTMDITSNTKDSRYKSIWMVLQEDKKRIK